ncbi:NAD-dependent epimerase/dehydratase family protein [Caenimonas sp. SL110]|uniref:NAD-dependent epimerase/dehydratase family protein n=1 Tax=Caenimonas sp. SL110 TaxID=1450524 RepID=UPI0006534EFA|nr:NAD-dependent epimerase/dehydratase family protein [Caenimonas sp. SL110]
MHVFLTGAGGYIGGTVAARLIAQGHRVSGLVRDPVKARLVQGQGIVPVLGDLDDLELLARHVREADATMNTASADHATSALAMIQALAGSGKAFIHTSGSSVIGDDARGLRVSDQVFDEETPFAVEPLKAARHRLNLSILAAADQNVRSVVICPSLIYGEGDGLQRDSIQIPFLVRQARASGVARVVGNGSNRWSTVHIADLAQLYLAALDRAPAGAFFFAENGESSFAEIGQAIAFRLGLGPVQSWPAEDAAAQWGEAKAYYTFGSNSRVRAVRARRELEWNPRHESAVAWIRDEMKLAPEEQER